MTTPVSPINVAFSTAPPSRSWSSPTSATPSTTSRRSLSVSSSREPSGASGDQSLLDNSECSDDGSMFARSASGKVLGSATNMAGDSVDVDDVVSAPCLQEIKVIAMIIFFFLL